MLAKYKTNEAYAFRTIIDTITPLYQDGIIRFREDGVYIHLTSSNIKTEIFFAWSPKPSAPTEQEGGEKEADTKKKDSYPEYEFKKKANVGIDFSHLQKALKDVHKGDTIEIVAEERDAKLVFTLRIFAKPGKDDEVEEGEIESCPTFEREIMTKVMLTPTLTFIEPKKTLMVCGVPSGKMKTAISSLITKYDNDKFQVYTREQEDVKQIYIESNGSIHRIRNMVPVSDFDSESPGILESTSKYPTSTMYIVSKCFTLVPMLTLESIETDDSPDGPALKILVEVGNMSTKFFIFPKKSDETESEETEESEPTKVTKKRKIQVKKTEGEKKAKVDGVEKAKEE